MHTPDKDEGRQPSPSKEKGPACAKGPMFEVYPQYRTQQTSANGREVPLAVIPSPCCHRAATLTPSPKISSPSTITSPRLMPIRIWMARAGETSALRRAIRLDLSSALHRVDHALELNQQAVTHGLDNASAVLGDRGIDQLQAMCLEPRQSTRFVDLHEAAVADHIGGQNGSETPLYAIGGQGSISAPCSSSR